MYSFWEFGFGIICIRDTPIDCAKRWFHSLSDTNTFIVECLSKDQLCTYSIHLKLRMTASQLFLGSRAGERCRIAPSSHTIATTAL